MTKNNKIYDHFATKSAELVTYFNYLVMSYQLQQQNDIPNILCKFQAVCGNIPRTLDRKFKNRNVVGVLQSYDSANTALWRRRLLYADEEGKR